MWKYLGQRFSARPLSEQRDSLNPIGWESCVYIAWLTGLGSTGSSNYFDLAVITAQAVAAEAVERLSYWSFRYEVN